MEINGKRMAKSAIAKWNRLMHGGEYEVTTQLLHNYEQELFAWKNPYQEWIDHCERPALEAAFLPEEKGADAIGKLVEFQKDEYGNQEINVGKLLGKYYRYTFSCANSDFLMIWSAEGSLSDFCLQLIKRALCSRPETQLLYGDDDFVWMQQRMHPFWKPDYSPETLESFCYFGDLLVISKSLAAQIGVNAESEMDSLYEIALQASALLEDHPEQVCHVQEILFHKDAQALWERTGREKQLETLDAGQQYQQHQQHQQYQLQQLLGELLQDLQAAPFVLEGYRGEAKTKTHTQPEKQFAPLCSIVILSKDNPKVLENCISSIREKTTYTNLEILVVDNGSNAENELLVRKLAERYDFTYLLRPMEFNFSAQCNIGIREAKGECICLLNDDVEVLDPEWLSKMLRLAGRPQVGAVGAKLYYAGGRKLQHVGVTNLAVGPAHKLLALEDDRNFYFGRNLVNYNMLAVTAACLVARKAVLEQVGLLNEDLRVAYNDVDLCMKLVEAGYRNVQCNETRLYHYESLSRGEDNAADAKWKRLLAEKTKLYALHPQFAGGKDPYYHPNLIDNQSEYLLCCKNVTQDNACFGRKLDASGKEASNGATNKPTNEPEYLKANGMTIRQGSYVRTRIDRCGLQRRFEQDGTDFFWMDGWAYVSGMNNAGLEKVLVLHSAKNVPNTEDSTEDSTEVSAEAMRLLYTAFSVFRPDVAQMAAGEQNVELAGFYGRIRMEDLPEDFRENQDSYSWQIGLMDQNGNLWLSKD